MNFLGYLLSGILIGFLLLFGFKTDEYLEIRAITIKGAAEVCIKDPSCYLTMEDYESYIWATGYLYAQDDK